MKGLSSGMLAKTHQLGAAEAAAGRPWPAAIRRMHVAHLVDGVHVDARLAGGHVDRRADPLRSARAPRAASPSPRRRPAVMPLCTRAVNPPTKSTPHSAAARVQRLGHLHGRRRARARPGASRPGEMASRLLVTGMPYLAPTRSQTSTSRLARRDDLLPQLAAEVVHVRRGAVVDVQRQRHRPHVEVLGVQHLDGREDFVGAKHGRAVPAASGVSRNWLVATKMFSCWSFTVKPSSWPICSRSAWSMRMSQWAGTSTWPISTNSSPVRSPYRSTMLMSLPARYWLNRRTMPGWSLPKARDDEAVRRLARRRSVCRRQRRADQHLELRRRPTRRPHPLGQPLRLDRLAAG